jgi:hypothetical protein
MPQRHAISSGRCASAIFVNEIGTIDAARILRRVRVVHTQSQ